MMLKRSENKLIDACRDGDREAFGHLFEIYSKRVFSVALRFSGDMSVAMDVTQDTFLKLFSSIHDFRRDSRFDSWMYRLVVNRCHDHHRLARRFIPMPDELVGTLRARADTVADMLNAERQNSVRSAVACLSPPLRIAVELRYSRGLSYDEIAATIGCAPGTVASRLSRAHNVLHRRLAHLAFPKRRTPEIPADALAA